VRAALLICCSFLAVFSSRFVRADGETLPKKLSAYSGGGWTGFYFVELDGDSLLYWRDPSNKDTAERIKPSLANWRAFREELDAIAIWQWHSDYSTRAIFDATHWTFEVEYSDRSVKTGGDSGVFPDKDGSAVSPSRAFPNYAPESYVRYVWAVQKLLDCREFPQ